ncbi:hypothetical protein HPG69_008183, partial [Diceros bicornis minor]
MKVMMVVMMMIVVVMIVMMMVVRDKDDDDDDDVRNSHINPTGISGMATGETQFRGPGVECKDIDECSQNPLQCGHNSVCKNLPGRYKCSCLPGFSSPTGNNWNPGKPGRFACTGNALKLLGVGLSWTATIELGTCVSHHRHPILCLLTLLHRSSDINEFLSSGICSEHSECSNSLGSYSCSCQDGFFSNNSTCEMWMNVWIPELAQSMRLATTVLEGTIVSATQDLFPAVETRDSTVQERSVKILLSAPKIHHRVVPILSAPMPQAPTAWFPSSVKKMCYPTISRSGYAKREQRWSLNMRKLKMNSRIAGGIMTGKKKDGFSDPIIYTLENIEPKQKSESPICVSWSTDAEGGRWTPSGCVMLEASETHTVCSCNRMANLAIIMAPGELTLLPQPQHLPPPAPLRVPLLGQDSFPHRCRQDGQPGQFHPPDLDTVDPEAEAFQRQCRSLNAQRHQVREDYRRWITRKIKPRAQSETSGTLLSSLPSTSKTVRDGVFYADSGQTESLLLSNTKHCHVLSTYCELSASMGISSFDR